MFLLHASKEPALAAKASPQAREKFIQQSKEDILKVASKTCRKYISRSDDEWSIALYAFSKAIDSYDASKGDFKAFAALLIQRDLIDFYRREERLSPEIPASPGAFEGSGEEDEKNIEYAVAKESIKAADSSLKDEIAALAKALAPFGFSFMDLTECSPKQDRSRESCKKAIDVLVKDKELRKKMVSTKQLPASEIIRKSGVSQKLLDKYRKYIIASAMILSDEYPCLGWYLKPKERRQT